MTGPIPGSGIGRLDQFIRSAETSPGLSSTSSTKFEDLAAWLGKELGADPDKIRATYVANSGSFTARRGSIASAHPTLALLVVGSGLDAVAQRAEELVADATEAVGVVGKESGSWRTEVLVRRAASQVADDFASLVSPSAVKIVAGPSTGAGAATARRRRQPPTSTFDLESLIAAVARAKLKISETVLTSVWAALEAEKHVVLTGPPGTAKTSLAEVVADLAVSSSRAAGKILSTATSDWTTYETIGGLRPASGMDLEFQAGQFLQAIDNDSWLIIDELNRSNFDRAFGQLFTVLSGQTVELPYRRPGQDGFLSLVPARQKPPEAGDYLQVPAGWRIVATMNVFDKSLLYEMSYAMMRRFAFVEVPSPPRADFVDLLQARAGGDQTLSFKVAQGLMGVRRVRDIGPASFLDLVDFANN